MPSDETWTSVSINLQPKDIEYPNDSEFWSSDLNNDGMVNVLDVVQLVNLILE